MDPEAELRDAEEIVLITRGRKTGRPHEATMWCAYEDGSIWLLGDTWDSIYPLAGRKALLALLTPSGALDTSFGSTP